jgi:hypothetical protein
MILFLSGFPLSSHANYEITLHWYSSDQDREFPDLTGKDPVSVVDTIYANSIYPNVAKAGG